MHPATISPEIFFFSGTVYLVFVSVSLPPLLASESKRVEVKESVFWFMFLSLMSSTFGAAFSIWGLFNSLSIAPALDIHTLCSNAALVTVSTSFIFQLAATAMLMGRLYDEKFPLNRRS